MTFDRFIKQLFAEELSGFPNTVYKDDCWYSFTPQGVMHQVFVHHRRGINWLEYGSSALVSALEFDQGNRIDQKILGVRPHFVANLEYKSRYEIEVWWKDAAKDVEFFRTLLKEFIVPVYDEISTTEDLYQVSCRRGTTNAAKRIKEGRYPAPIVFSFTSVKQACDICAYLGYIDQGLQWIQETRKHYVHVYCGDSFDEYKGNKILDEYRAELQKWQAKHSEEEQFLHQSKEFQRAKLRENFEENRVKIHDFLGIDPEFDMDFIFPEG